jgi:hypothetical protein
MYPKYERTVKTLEKAGFTVVREFRDSHREPGTRYEAGFTARKPGTGRRIEVSKQEDVCITMRVIRDNDRDDSMSDYTAGTWVDTVKRAVDLASQPQVVAPAVDRLAVIRQQVRENQLAGRGPYEGLSSADIGRYNRALMFGDNDETMPSSASSHGKQPPTAAVATVVCPVAQRGSAPWPT